jgi:hypothetical protein
MSDLIKQITAATDWLLREAQHISFGEIGVMLILHRGRIARVERITIEKTQDAESAPRAITVDVP